ncbi:MAG TPA: CHAT domain-containing protein, partial [Acidimicrobiales bacterium]
PESLARASMAISLLSLGDAAAADREIARAGEIAPESARGLVDLLVALVQQRTGRLDESLARYSQALPRLRREADDANISRLLINRGTLFAYQGAIGAALADLAEAERLATDLELWVLVAMAAHNLGFTEGRRGQVPAALAAFDRAEAAYAALGGPPRLVAGLASDRCEVLLSVGLTRDARGSAQRALEVLGEAGDAAQLSESRLLFARACLAQGDLPEAGREAKAAARDFRAARRVPWAAVADYVAMQAEMLTVEDLPRLPAAGMLTRTKRISRLLESQGWPVEAMHVRTFHARVALALGRPEVARAELVDVGRARSRGPAERRAQAWHATALLRLADEDRPGAKRALRRGLDVIDEHRAGLGATELRAGIAAQGRELARLGLRLSLAEGRAWEILRWAERWRAGALRLPPVTPPEDPVLTAALEELRETRGTQRDATLAGEPSPALDQRIAALEDVVRGRTLQADSPVAVARFRLDQTALTAALDDATLVEFLTFDDRLFAVTVAAGRARLHEIGPTKVVEEEQQYLLFALRRLLASPGTAAEPVNLVTWQAVARRLDEILLGPLGPLGLPDAPVVIVPTGSLHGLSWGSLPSLAGRSVTIAPSAELWHRRGRAAGAVPGRRTALVAGPDLPGADAEVVRLAELYRGATVLRGAKATVAAVLAAMADADLVHLAAHGTFRADSPLFSSLRLADGTLTVYELEHLRATPSTVVLAACDAAQVDVLDGDELLGTATAMLGLGVASVVVPVMAVPDEATAPIMTALHGGLRRGRGPSLALAEAAVSLGDDGYGRAVAAAFVCLGANERATR